MTFDNGVKFLNVSVDGQLKLKKERGEDNSIREVGGHLLYGTNILKSQGYARTLVQPVQNFGERIKIERSD